MVFDGRYGRPGHKRQRYRCYPGGVGGNGRAFHRFVPALPREPAVHDECGRCERPLSEHEGPQVPRWSLFPAHDIAESLVTVGRGLTYQTASYELRKAAARWPPGENGEPRRSFTGQLVADMVEVFAPVVFDEHRKWEWPRDTLVVDHLSFHIAAFREDGSRIPKGQMAFNILAALGYEDGRSKLWRLEASPKPDKPDWARFFRSLDGQPERIVCDAHAGLLTGIQEVWPQADICISEWHLKEAMRVRLRLAGYRDESSDVWLAMEASFNNTDLWEHWKVKAYRIRKQAPRLWSWVETFEPIILWQLYKRPREERWDEARWEMVRERPREWARTTAGLERKLLRLRDWVRPRRYVLKNRERMDRLLMLMQLELNRDANMDAYSRSIREWLDSRGCRPIPRRQIEDRKGKPSLRP